MRPIWGRQDPGGPHVVPMDLAIRDVLNSLENPGRSCYLVDPEISWNMYVSYLYYSDNLYIYLYIYICIYIYIVGFHHTTIYPSITVHTSLQWLREKIYQNMQSQNTPLASLTRTTYEVPIETALYLFCLFQYQCRSCTLCCPSIKFLSPSHLLLWRPILITNYKHVLMRNKVL